MFKIAVNDRNRIDSGHLKHFRGKEGAQILSRFQIKEGIFRRTQKKMKNAVAVIQWITIEDSLSMY